MRTFQHVSSLRAFVRAAKQDGKSIGFVPTMGALHEGHLALCKRAKSDCDIVILSIFVNPTQFGANEDLAKYPRPLNKDKGLAQQVGVDAAFLPEIEDIYPEGCHTTVEVGPLAEILEGKTRPGHFRGVATICTKLFNIVQPDRAYFGQKDYQQLRVIESIVKDLFIPVKIVPVATLRDTDGLALSSRNLYLSDEERLSALSISRSLNLIRERANDGAASLQDLQTELLDNLQSESGLRLDYAQIVHPETLLPVEDLSQGAVALVAAWAGSTRLIDNIILKNPT